MQVDVFGQPGSEVRGRQTVAAVFISAPQIKVQAGNSVDKAPPAGGHPQVCQPV